ncbi:5-formyltetrahydrofolate cyclo-ligase [Iocasia frigidifontis]|uniref:5-formyltetrahydrofolate cyclo-ligase n=1 Tax=Iocasia fonsfrigidae TaxID=2682810 RepID=A0A8A7KD36_9FIRM|nr:5-formyltetrahydrofolate cyclo-ligase [Iocasia fonsfrigidae]QTL98015.1 5-formyltetrahydrofolate cyclo-ligase [Iocasia fonsfrigidae]
MIDKKKLREKYLAKRSSLTAGQVKKASDKIAAKFLDIVDRIAAERIMLYYSFRNEVITHDIIDKLLVQNKEVFLPYTVVAEKELQISRINDIKEDLIEGVYGVMEPRKKENQSIKDLDIVVVPGMVFTKKGYRLGYGGGYYDRFLSRLSEITRTIGFVFDSFLLNELTLEEHDLPVEMIITEKNIIDFRGDDY